MNKDLKSAQQTNDPNIENALIEDGDETYLRANSKTIYNADLTSNNEPR